MYFIYGFHSKGSQWRCIAIYSTHIHPHIASVYRFSPIKTQSIILLQGLESREDSRAARVGGNDAGIATGLVRLGQSIPQLRRGHQEGILQASVLDVAVGASAGKFSIFISTALRSKHAADASL